MEPVRFAALVGGFFLLSFGLAAYRKAAKQHPYRGAEPAELKGVGIPESFMHPVQAAGGVVVAHGGPLVAFDAATGRQLWQARSSGHSSPLR